MESTSPNLRGRTLAIIGAWMQTALLIGFMGTVLGMKGAFAELGKQHASDVGALSEHIGKVLVWTIAGQSVAAVGAIFLGIAVIALRYRRIWAIVIFALASLNLVGVAIGILRMLVSSAL